MPGVENERRDREAKLKLYLSRGVQEYWIGDWFLQQVEVYRRENATLGLIATLLTNDELRSPFKMLGVQAFKNTFIAFPLNFLHYRFH